MPFLVHWTAWFGGLLLDLIDSSYDGGAGSQYEGGGVLGVDA
jgi:hypothetical protein